MISARKMASIIDHECTHLLPTFPVVAPDPVRNEDTLAGIPFSDIVLDSVFGFLRYDGSALSKRFKIVCD